MHSLERDVTLVAVDCTDVKKVVDSIDICLKYVKFEHIKLLTSITNDLSYAVAIAPIGSFEEYSRFMVKELYKYVETPFCLVIQHDSWICNPRAWDDDWFNYDYIGGIANWSHNGSGNGGFSFRSKKLLEIGSQVIADDKCHPEDTALASDMPEHNGHRPKLVGMGLQFATGDIQSKFGLDCGIWNGQFGQHKCNLINWKNPLSEVGQNNGKIYDCFVFYNEFDVLDIRLHEMCGIVEKFVLVEANQTHSGKPKPCYYSANAHRFAKFKDKIVHHIVDLPHTDNPWGNENFQRDCIFDALIRDGADDNDIIIVSDVDEIPGSRQIIDNLDLINSKDIVGMRQNKYNYKLNLLGGEYWDKGFIARLKFLRNGISHIRMHHKYNSAFDCGWHFSWLGGLDAVKDKIRAYAHQELNNEGFIKVVEQCYADGRYLIGGEKLRVVDVDHTFPRYVRSNIALFRGHIK